MVLNTLESIKDRKFDIVFLCRSDNWLPPHLDNEFQELVDFIVRKFKTIRIDPQVKKAREIDNEIEKITHFCLLQEESKKEG